MTNINIDEIDPDWLRPLPDTWEEFFKSIGESPIELRRYIRAGWPLGRPLPKPWVEKAHKILKDARLTI